MNIMIPLPRGKGCCCIIPVVLMLVSALTLGLVWYRLRQSGEVSYKG